MNNDFLEFLGFIGVAVGGVFLLLAVILTPAHFIEKTGCENYANLLGFEYKHSLSGGCVVKSPEGWIKSSNYIINKEEKQ